MQLGHPSPSPPTRLQTLDYRDQQVPSTAVIILITWLTLSEHRRVTLCERRRWRSYLKDQVSAPKTINNYTSSVASFFKFLQASAAELRLPINIANPAHAQFVSREADTPVKETDSLTLTQIRQLLAMPEGDDVIAMRDRAILKFYYLSGSRLAAGCNLNLAHFRLDGPEGPQYRTRIKGGKWVTKGLHVAAASAIDEYLTAAELTRGPLFRSRVKGKGRMLSTNRISETSMYRLIMSYLRRLPGAMYEEELIDEEAKTTTVVKRCRYHPHILRATYATLSYKEAGVDIVEIQQQMDHRNITTTRHYTKVKLGPGASASHSAPL